MEAAPQINHTTFFKRLNHLFSIWNDVYCSQILLCPNNFFHQHQPDRSFNENRMLILLYGKDDPDAMIVKTEALQYLPDKNNR